MSETVDLGPESRIPPGEGRTFEVDGRRVAVFRTRQGELFATQAACPHRAGPLADGLLGGRTVVCPVHGRKFDLATGQPLGHACAALATYPVAVEDGHVRLRITGGPRERDEETCDAAR